MASPIKRATLRAGIATVTCVIRKCPPNRTHLSMRTGILSSNREAKPSVLFWCALAALALLGIALLWRATALGAGISPDSTVYVSMARSYLNALGFEFVLQSGGDFPPFYSMLLAFGG